MRLSEYSFDNHRVHKICNQTLSTFFDSLEKIAGNDQLRYFINQVGIIQGYLTHPPGQSSKYLQTGLYENRKAYRFTGGIEIIQRDEMLFFQCEYIEIGRLWVCISVNSTH